jgi:hypothetical protein
MSISKHFRDVRRIATDCGIDDPEVVVESRGHPRLTGVVNGKPVVTVFSLTPSDHRFPKKIRAQLRRLVREIAA